MANITITGTMTVDIHLDNLSMDSYNRLIAFIEGLGSEDIAEPEKPVDQPVEKPSSGTAHKPGNQSLEQLRDRDRTKPLYDLLLDARAHPDRYEWRWMTSKKLLPLMPEELRESDTRHIGHTLSMFAKYGMIEKRPGTNMVMEFNYPQSKAEPIPDPVKSDESQDPLKNLNWRDRMMGERLRKARKSAALSLTELSHAIGYGADIINRWETGCYHMAEAQRDCINKYFGRDIFATA